MRQVERKGAADGPRCMRATKLATGDLSGRLTTWPVPRWRSSTTGLGANRINALAFGIRAQGHGKLTREAVGGRRGRHDANDLEPRSRHSPSSLPRHLL